MNKILLRRLLRRIQEHGYYHFTDEVLVEWFLSGRSAAEIAKFYPTVTTDMLYKQKERLKNMEPMES